MATPTAKEALAHLFENVLDLDTEDIELVGKAGYRKYNVFSKVSYNTLTVLRDKDKITTSLWQQLSDFRMYIDAVDPSYATIMLMTAASWDDVDVIMLRLNHVLTETAVSSPSKI